MLIVRLALPLLLTTALFAQTAVPKAEPYPGRRSLEEAVSTQLKSARSMSEAGRHAAALRSLRRALIEMPGDRELLMSIVATCEEAEPASLGLARMDLALAAAEVSGRLPRDRHLREALGPDEDALEAAVTRRTQVVLALIALAEKEADKKAGTPGRLLARDLLDRAMILAGPSPELTAEVSGAFRSLDEAVLGDVKLILKGLKSAMDRAQASRRFGRAIILARTLSALATQASFHDLMGPKAPNLRAAAMAGRRGLRLAREGLDAKLVEEGEGPLTVEQLRAMDEEQIRAFDEAHRSWAKPGLAVSPTGLYRVESTCGHTTLLGVAETVELHHKRLVSWYGQDPFEGRPGLVRIVPRSAGLESEGTPYWWAQGFQSGDITTIKFLAGTIEGLGRTLTHELTHRFDGAIYGGFPAWLSEGRAVWTGQAYAGAASERFVDRHLNIGTVEHTFIMGYGGEKAFEHLVNGTLDDYRHNYFAGYALWQWISTWKVDGQAIFAKPLEAYLQRVGRSRGAGMRLFLKHFADGRSGRPDGQDELMKAWHAYLKGHHWQSRAPWLSEYQTKLRRKRSPYVYDGAIWHRDRSRSEPWLGDDQALIAARLLAEEGKTKEAAAAYAWAVDLEEPEPGLSEEGARALAAAGEDLAAWAVRTRSARRFGHEAPKKAPAPLRAARGVVSSLRKAEEAAQALVSTRPLAAAALLVDLRRSATGLGLEEGFALPQLPAAEGITRSLDPSPVHLGLYGWHEEGLSGFEERRHEGLWFAAEDGSVTVGRKAERSGTGSRDRTAHRRDAFTRSRRWLTPGRYTLHTRIHATTSYISGAIIVGHTRRDRGVRVGFTAGDFMFSIGEKEEAANFDSVYANLDGLREREGALPGVRPGRSVKLRNVGSSFEVRVFVDGPELTLKVDDEVVGTYHDPDGRPIEGYIGFATRHGAFRAARPIVEEHHRRAATARDSGWPRGLDLSSAGTERGRLLRNRATGGIPTGERGTIAVFVPPLREKHGKGDPLPDDKLTELALKLAQRAEEGWLENAFGTKLVLLVPESIGSKQRVRLIEELDLVAPFFEAPLYHRWESHLDARPRRDNDPSPTASVLFLDPRGVLRAHARPSSLGLSRSIVHPAKVFEARALDLERKAAERR